MRVGLLVDQYFNTTGVGTSTRHLVDHLLRLDQTTEYVLLYPGADAARLPFDQPNVRVQALPDRRLLYPFWFGLGWLPVELWTGPLDLLHTPVGSVRLPSRAPLLATIHDIASERHPGQHPLRRRRFKKGLLRYLVGRPDATLSTISRSTRDDVADWLDLDAAAIPVVHHGVDTDRFRPATKDEIARVRQAYLLPSRFFLFLGGAGPRKSLDVLLESFRAFLDRPEAEGVDLVLAGPPSSWANERFARLTAELESAGRMRHIGFVDDADVAALYSAALAFTYPSRYEGFGLPVLEAMACGTPVVCSDAMALPEVAGGAALVVPVESVHALAGALARLASEPDLRSDLVARGRERVQSFAWDDAARRTQALHAHLAAGRSPATFAPAAE